MVSGQSSRRAALAEINVTPLVDVMLVLLIIFMITRAHATARGGSQPAGSHQQAPHAVRGATRPHHHQGGRACFSTARPTRWRRCVRTCKVLSQAQPNQEMFLRADAEVPYGRVVQVMDAVKKAGILRLGMITQPEPDTR